MKLGVVLGAGFSKAVDRAFPTVDELGELVREQVPDALASAPPEFRGGAFERWLSRIAEPQPDLSDADNLGNARDFLLVTAAIHKQMVGIEADLLQRRIPWWLLRFIGLLHEQEYTCLLSGHPRKPFGKRRQDHITTVIHVRWKVIIT